MDVSFWFGDFLFTLTLANAIKNKECFSQIEIEYDGHSNLVRRPSKKAIFELFDNVIADIVPNQQPYFVTTTKTEWLNGFDTTKKSSK